MINGTAQTLALTSGTLAVVAENIGVSPEGRIAELNGVVIPQAQWAATVVQDGDVIEIIQFMGGG